MNIVTNNKIIAILIIAIMIITMTTPIFAAIKMQGITGLFLKFFDLAKKLMDKFSKIFNFLTPEPPEEPTDPSGIKDSQITKNSIVKTGVDGALPKVTRAELVTMIENASITRTGDRRENLLAKVDKFIEIQENYNVNALFAVAVAIEETEAGTKGYGKSRNNWFNIRYSNGEYKSYDTVNASIENFGTLISGGTYFGANKLTIIDIGKTYCDSTWATKIANHMNSLVDYL